MNFIFKMATINVNGIRASVTQSLLKSFLFNYDLDIIMLQEVNDNNLDFLLPQYKYITNTGDSLRGTAVIFRANLSPSDIEKSLCGRIIAVTINNIRLVNIYAPSGSNRRTERNLFFSQELIYFLRNINLPIVLCGDFNCVTDSTDQNSLPTNFCASLQRLCASLKLTDVWRHLFPRKVEFSFYRNTSASRLDRFYVSPEMIKQINNCEILPVAFTDHSAVIFELRVANRMIPNHYGRGTWKLNSSLLQETHVCTEFVKLYQKWSKSQNRFRNRYEWRVNFVKPKTKQFFTRCSITKSREFNETFEFFSSVLCTLRTHLNQGENSYNEYINVKHKIIELQRNKLIGCTVRCCDKTLVTGEQTSLYHLARLKKRRESRFIKSVIKEDGKTTSTRNELLHECHTHFSAKFATLDARTSQIDHQLIKFLPVLTSDQQTRVGASFTEREIRDAIKYSSKISSPGPDGLSYNFYKKFIDLVVPDLTSLFNEILTTQCSTACFSEGQVVLLPKTKNPRIQPHLMNIAQSLS